MKKIVGISLFIFWAVVAAVLADGLLFYQNNNKINNSISIADSLLPENNINGITLDSQEIARHNAASNCWMIIDGTVYNFTSYLSGHPGGAASIIPYCGKDGSEAFATKDQNKPVQHSDYAKSLFESYYIGDLNQKIGQPRELAQNQISESAINDSLAVSTPAPIAQSAIANFNIILNAQEISKHSSTADCWIIINSKIYNVTSYLGAHPGGAGAIAPYCGKDAAQAFLGLPHSSSANNLLANYFIGDLNQTTEIQQLQQNIQNTATIAPLTNSKQDNKENEEEDDDD